MKRSWLLCVCLLAVVSSARSSPPATVYEGARLIDGNGGAAIENSVFVVVDDKFTQIGRKGELPAAADAAHVDLTGKTVMPTLVDAHVHLGYRKGTTFTADNFTRATINEQLMQFEWWGVSAVLSTGTDIGDLVPNLRQVLSSRTYRYTLIRTAWRGIAPPDAGPFPPMRAAPFGVKTEAEARADVRQLASRKVDFVKIWVDDRNGTVPKLSPEIYTAIIDEAHKHNLRVIAHTVTLADVKALLRANIDGFAHLFRDREADAEVLSLLKDRPNVFIMLTLWAPRLASLTSPPSWFNERGLHLRATPDQIRQFGETFAGRTPQSVAVAREEWNTLKKNVATLSRAGVKLVLGTDVGGNTGGPLFGWTEHIELENMVDAGMTPAAAISAATKGSAEALRIRELGTIAVGKRADFIVLDSNPLDDITNSRKIVQVFQGGVVAFGRQLVNPWPIH